MATPRLSPDALLAQLNGLNAQGLHAESLALADANPALTRNAAPLLSAMSDAASALGQYERAESLRRQVLRLAPWHPSTANNLAVLLIRRSALDEAEALCRGLLARDPAHFEAHYNLALALQRRGAHAEAIALARQVLAQRPGHERSPYLIGTSLLALGRYEEGWPLFEARTTPVNAGGNVHLPPLTYPAWRGEPLAGKAILIWMEQGLGDEIMMARYPAVLKAMGAARVSWICRRPMAPLLRHVAGIDELYVAEGSLSMPTHDYWTLPMSMPLGCGTTFETIPAAAPYIGLDPAASARARALVGAAAGLKVGLAWKGNPTLLNDANRSLPGLETLAPLWAVEGASFFSLQKDAPQSEPVLGRPLTDLAPHLTDLGETAAIIEQLDVVVTVDTAIAHLAGALGKRALVLLPAIGTDWRWLHDRSDSPWYPSLRLYRQAAAGEWAPVVEAVAAELAARAG